MAPLKVQYFAWTAIQINGEWSTYVLKYFFERDQVHSKWLPNEP